MLESKLKQKHYIIRFFLKNQLNSVFLITFSTQQKKNYFEQNSILISIASKIIPFMKVKFELSSVPILCSQQFLISYSILVSIINKKMTIILCYAPYHRYHIFSFSNTTGIEYEIRYYSGKKSERTVIRTLSFIIFIQIFMR